MVHAAPAARSRVVHVHAPDATNWWYQPNYWDYLSQATVNMMVDRGVIELTGAVTVADAWRALLPNYQAGQKIAVKVNFNNTWDCLGSGHAIDAVIEPVNAVVSGLVQMGVARSDICVYDAIRALPDRFARRGLAGVSFYDGSYAGVCRNEAGFSNEPASRIAFHPPAGISIPDSSVSNVLMNATYLINLPIMKGGHPAGGVTLGFKNHFGTINNPGDLHDTMNIVSKPPAYRADYNPMVDLIASPLIGSKTVLTIADGLFAAREFNQAPVFWTTFGDHVPNSLFFARDPVAIDCVAHDFIAAELGTGLPDDANNYLRLAAQAGLGTFESANPWSESYALIDYRRINL